MGDVFADLKRLGPVRSTGPGRLGNVRLPWNRTMPALRDSRDCDSGLCDRGEYGLQRKRRRNLCN